MLRGAPESPLYPRKQTSSAQERFGLKKQTFDVCLTPESGRKWLGRGMSAFDPERTFVVLDVFRLSHERLLRWYELAPAHCILGTYSPGRRFGQGHPGDP